MRSVYYMIPLGSTIPLQRISWVTYALIGMNVGVFAYELHLGPQLESFLFSYGWVPSRFSLVILQPQLPPLVSLLTSIFLHGGWLHLLGNLFFLYVFGRHVEDRLGYGRYFSFYCLGGAIAMLVQTYVSPFSSVPMIGASGAIAAVAGAYCVFFPTARVLTLLPIPFAWRVLRVPTVGYVLVWLLLLLSSGLYLRSPSDHLIAGGAWAAHLGGFLAGIVISPFLLSLQHYVSRKKRVKRWRSGSPLVWDNPRSALR